MNLIIVQTNNSLCNKILTSVLVIFLFTTSSFIIPNEQLKIKYSTVLAIKKGKQLLSQCSRSTPKNIRKFWLLSTSDIEQVEKKLLDEFGEETLNEFGFQYLGIEINYKKLIYINAFRIGTESELETYYKNWKTDPIIVCDGGSTFWGMTFNLEVSTFSKPSFNGP